MSKTINYYKHTTEKPVNNPGYMTKHCFKLFKHILICGATGSGKSNTLLNLIERFNGTFYKIILCTKDSSEPLYQLLKEKIPQLKIYEGMKSYGKGSRMVQNVPKLKEVVEEDDQGPLPILVVFDDVCMDTIQNHIVQYFIRGRKLGVTCCYLTQSYYKTPKSIRLNVTYLLLKKGMAKRDLTSVLRETAIDIPIAKLVNIYNKATSQGDLGDFLMVDLLDNKLYFSFSTTPYCPSEQERDEEKHIPLDNPAYRGREDYASTKRQNAGLFVDELKQQAIGGTISGVFSFPEIYQGYVDYCSNNQFDPANKQMFSRILAKAKFRKDVDGKIPYYSIGL